MLFIVEMSHKLIAVVFLYSYTLMKLYKIFRLLSCSDTAVFIWVFRTFMAKKRRKRKDIYIGTKVSAAGFEAVFN